MLVRNAEQKKLFICCQLMIRRTKMFTASGRNRTREQKASSRNRSKSGRLESESSGEKNSDRQRRENHTQRNAKPRPAISFVSGRWGGWMDCVSMDGSEGGSRGAYLTDKPSLTASRSIPPPQKKRRRKNSGRSRQGQGGRRRVTHGTEEERRENRGSEAEAGCWLWLAAAMNAERDDPAFPGPRRLTMRGPCPLGRAPTRPGNTMYLPEDSF
jgi:hypothetical protein